MNVDSFLDTNVFVYAVSIDVSEKFKRDIALKLIETEDFALSAQVLQEYFVTVTRKLEISLTPQEALKWMNQFQVFPCIAISADLVKRGVNHSIRYQISYWDGAIIAAAEESGATILYSEDLNHEQKYGTITVINPFKSTLS